MQNIQKQNNLDKRLVPLERILRLPEVLTITGLGSTSIYKKMNEGTFPQSVDLDGRSKGWIDTEVKAWVDELKAARKAS